MEPIRWHTEPWRPRSAQLYPRYLQDLRRQDSGSPADLAAVEIIRDRERVPRYCGFRRLLRMKAPETFLKLTSGRV